MSITNQGRHSILRTSGLGPEGVKQIQKIWRAWKPQDEIDREIACHTAAEAMGVAPKLYKVGQLGGAECQMYMSMRHLTRNFLQYVVDEDPCVVQVALEDIRWLYESLDDAGVLHNDADPRNAMVDDANGKWYLIDYGKSRMRDSTDAGDYNVKVTFTIMAVMARQSPHW